MSETKTKYKSATLKELCVALCEAAGDWECKCRGLHVELCCRSYLDAAIAAGAIIGRYNK
jgi:hypothetical protein